MKKKFPCACGVTTSRTGKDANKFLRVKPPVKRNQMKAIKKK